MKLVIWGLARGTSAKQVSELLTRVDRVNHYVAGQVVVQEVPGDNDQAYAVVELGLNHMQTYRLAGMLDGRRFGSNRLQPWVPVMEWR
jgi:hypothetical protein